MALMESTSASLLERLRQPKDKEAWPRFVELYTPLLYFWARRAALQRADAADLVQEVFAILVQKLPTFQYDPGKSFRSWLRTITMNKWREKLRRPSPAQAADGQLSEIAEREAESSWDQEYQDLLVSRAMTVMQTDFDHATWKACWEFVVEGRSAAEVAEELGLTVNAVYLAKGRVLRRLRHELAGLLD